MSMCVFLMLVELGLDALRQLGLSCALVCVGYRIRFVHFVGAADVHALLLHET